MTYLSSAEAVLRLRNAGCTVYREQGASACKEQLWAENGTARFAFVRFARGYSELFIDAFIRRVRAGHRTNNAL